VFIGTNISLVRGGKSGVFTPASLFANGEQGAWYDPSDLTTLYQDSAGTTPVTADGDPVGRMEDKSGNGNHATQAGSTSRPVYRTDGTLRRLKFDGVDDVLVVGSRMGIAADPNLTIAAALVPYDYGKNNTRAFQIGSGSIGDGNLAAGFGTAGWSWRYDNGNNIYQPVNFTTCAVARWERDAGSHLTNSERFFYNGLQQSSTGSSTPSLNNNDGAFIGAESGSKVNTEMDLFGLVVVDAIPASRDKESLDNYLAEKAGVTL